MIKASISLKTPRELIRVAGVCFALSATILLLKLIVVVQSPNVMFSDSIIGIPLIALMLLVVSMFNDFFCTKLGERILSSTMLLGCIVAPLGFILTDFNAAFVPFMAVGIASALLLCGEFLASLDHRYLYFVSSIAFIFTGLTVMFTLSLDSQSMLVLVAVYFMLALTCRTLFKENQTQQTATVSAGESRNRNIPGRGNRFTLFTIGLISGISIYFLSDFDFGFDAMPFISGGIIVLCGLLVLIAGQRYQKVFEDTARRSMALCAALALLPMPFVPAVVQIVCIAVLLVSTCINLIILINAMAETARKRQISPLWLFGFEGAFFMVGLWAGVAGFWLAFSGLLLAEALTVACALAVTVIIIMQVFIENQTYPFFDEHALTNAAEDDDYYIDVRQFTHKGGAIWKEKLDLVAEIYDLSPRQSEVMELLVKGRDAKYIMDYFVVSRSTAKTHTYNLYKKLGIHSRQELLDLVEHTQTPSIINN